MRTKQMNWKKSNRMIILLLSAVTMVFSMPLKVYAEENETLNIYRHEGYSRDNVAENVAKAHFSDSRKVILVNRAKFPDAISATNISQGRYPVLYTHTGYVTDGTMDLIQSMSLDEIYVLDGELSISKTVVNQLKNDLGIKVTRIEGRSRYDANVSAIKANFTQHNQVIIASGEVYSDALYGVSLANTYDAPVVLAKTDRLEPSTVELLKELNVKNATIIGGSLTLTSNVETQLNELGIKHDRIAGRNRYIGSAQVAAAAYQSPENIVIASGEVFSDALVSAPLAQKLNAPILLVRSNHMESIVENYIKDSLLTIKNLYIHGGPITIEHSLLKSIFQKTPDTSRPAAKDMIKVDFDNVIFNQEVLSLVNEERAHVGVNALVYEKELQKGADIRTLDSISIQTLYMDHARPDGSPWYTAFNYLNGTLIFISGENIAYNGITYEECEKLAQIDGALEKRLAQTFYKQYADSPEHYQNMISERYNGMAVSTMFANHNNSTSVIRVYNTMVFSNSY